MHMSKEAGPYFEHMSIAMLHMAPHERTRGVLAPFAAAQCAHE